MALDTTTCLTDLHKHAKDLNSFLPFKLKIKAVTVKMNVIYFGIDTIFRPFHEAPI